MPRPLLLSLASMALGFTIGLAIGRPASQIRESPPTTVLPSSAPREPHACCSRDREAAVEVAVAPEAPPSGAANATFESDVAKRLKAFRAWWLARDPRLPPPDAPAREGLELDQLPLLLHEVHELERSRWMAELRDRMWEDPVAFADFIGDPANAAALPDLMDGFWTNTDPFPLPDAVVGACADLLQRGNPKVDLALAPFLLGSVNPPGWILAVVDSKLLSHLEDRADFGSRLEPYQMFYDPGERRRDCLNILSERLSPVADPRWIRLLADLIATNDDERVIRTCVECAIELPAGRARPIIELARSRPLPDDLHSWIEEVLRRFR